MYLFVCLFINAILFMNSLVGSARSFSELSPRIAGGSVVDIKQFPYMVNLRIDFIDDWGGHTAYCCGVIIGERWILTAAHCFKGRGRVNQIIVHGGSSSASGREGFRSRCRPAILHPNYDSDTSNYDFALVNTLRTMNFTDKLDYIDLPAEVDTLIDGDLCWAIGWGSLGYENLDENALKSGRDDPPEEDLLHAVILPVFAHRRCNKIHNNTLTRRMVCAGYENATTNKGVCNGDSGSPLVYNGVLFGIASFVVENEPCGKNPQVFGRVTSIRNWIKRVAGISPPS